MSKQKLTTANYLFPFIMITALFFLWGLAHGLLDVLNKHFQEILKISKAKSGMIQFAMYMAYFSMAFPAGMFMKKFGYKKGVLLGLSLFASGALLIAATTGLESFYVFITCLFIMGCGLATLETAANPYTTKLGPTESAERRINLSQSFNGLAWTVGPLIGVFIYGNGQHSGSEKLGSLTLPYLIIGTVVLIVAIIFSKTHLPEIHEAEADTHQISSSAANGEIILGRQRNFVLSVIALFAYCAAQTGVFSYLINFVTDPHNSPHFDASLGPYFLSIGFFLFMIGRMSGSYLMRFIAPSKLLAYYALMAMIALVFVAANLGWLSFVALYAVFFFMSIMFPTIFSLGIKGLGDKTTKASSYLIMSIVGGAVFPPLMGWVADTWSMSLGFLAPIPFFAFIFYFGINNLKIKA